MSGTPIRRRRAAKYVRGGFRVCYLCQYEKPDEIHHTSYFPEEAVAVCSTCHKDIHRSDTDTGLEPDEPRPDDYEKTRRRQEAEEKPEWQKTRVWQSDTKMKLELNSRAARAPFRDLPHPEVEE